MSIRNTQYTNTAFGDAQQMAEEMRHEFITPEHLLAGLLMQIPFSESMEDCGLDSEVLLSRIQEFLETELETVPDNIDYQPEISSQLQNVIRFAYLIVENSGATSVDVPHLAQGILQLEDSWANHILQNFLGEELGEWISRLITCYEQDSAVHYTSNETNINAEKETEPWRRFITCINDTLSSHNPLIGRDEELERTIQVLCRKEKNNPLHVGEPGVGKTSLAYGLASLIEKGNVPERISGCRIYELDLGSLLAGTQFRGDFEKRLKNIMEGLEKEGNAIVYIDEIHNLVGTGRTGDSSMDASNLLKPYLENGKIRFIGSTTYEEYNRYFARSKGLVRRFQQIDIPEPSVSEAVRILEGLRPRYEEFHNVKYEDNTIEYAVRASSRFITDRFLPDKAIDLIDEAGAYCEISRKKTVSRELINSVLSRICKVDMNAINEEESSSLENLGERISSQIYGQPEAISRVVEAIQMSKAGLTDENKPVASLLFVGPTGVGKTEVARVLASELGIRLIRFDMSEYTEKHTVAKLIGSPAGYVGYEDGGLLTDAIRKSPNCVLLLDEIEKAHPDIFNILLQVMDYGTLTDNKGRKSDCRHVILIMTSNAGAQHAHQAGIGFTGSVTPGEAMYSQVKRTFKPEFINRLTGTVIFHSMNHEMANMILDKKLGQLKERLKQRNVSLSLSEEAHQWLLDKGFTREYGAREIDRVIGNCLNPLLMREILFGKLKNGGKATAEINPSDSNGLIIKSRPKPVRKKQSDKQSK